MEAKLNKLKGKYYSTSIRIKNDRGGVYDVSICRTDNDGFEPSDRELNNLGYTREDWDNNIEINNGWGGKSPIQECELIDFSHFESQDTYLDALKIIEAINKYI